MATELRPSPALRAINPIAAVIATAKFSAGTSLIVGNRNRAIINSVVT